MTELAIPHRLRTPHHDAASARKPIRSIGTMLRTSAVLKASAAIFTDRVTNIVTFCHLVILNSKQIFELKEMNEMKLN